MPRVYGVIGSFNGWDEGANEMKRLEPGTIGIFELFIPGVEEGDLYKYLIETKDGKRLYKADRLMHRTTRS